MRKIRIGDEVVVTAGRDKGRKGKVLRMLEKKHKFNHSVSSWLLVEGINMVSKHVKPNPQANVEGGIVPKESPIHYSNVQLFDASGKPSRVGIRTLEDGQRVRYFKSTGEVVDV